MEPASSPWSRGFGRSSSTNLDRVGRDGFLRLQFEKRRGHTVLIGRNFTLPLQVMEPISLENNGSLYLMLLNPTGGLVGGDSLRTEITLGPEAHVSMTTPAATKVYRTLGPATLQCRQICLGRDATLEY